MWTVNWPQLKGFWQFHFSSESCLMLQPDVAFHTKPLCCVSCQVTIFGESAGAQSVSLHLMIQSSKPLFKQAVLQSLPFSIPLKTRWGSDSHWLPLCDSFVPDWRCKILWNQKAVRSIFLRGGGVVSWALAVFKPGPQISSWTVILFFSDAFPDTMPWSWEKALLNRPTALWATSSACCLSLHRPSWLPRWKQVGRHKHQPTLAKFRATLRAAYTVT